jgi:amino acid transporter
VPVSTHEEPAVDTASIEAAVETAPVPRVGNTLKPGAIGLVAVLFMATANAAPITAMTGNTPISVGFGNGIGAPAGFLVATIVLSIFAVGYVAMARHVTTTGAFYGFISQGLGQIWGMAAGLLATLAYVVFEASLVGIFSSFAKVTVETMGGPELSWIVYGLLCIAVAGVLGYFDIAVSGKVLGVFLVSEVVLLGLLALGILVTGGGPDGLMPEAVNPLNAFDAAPASADGAIIGAAGIGLFFAFWSWVGFETTAVYGEESKNPKKIVPRATMIAVIGLGLFYTFVSWMVIAQNGEQTALDVSRGSTGSAFDLFFVPTEDVLGSFALDIYKILTVVGSFGCALAFHNAASRYLFALGREAASERVRGSLGSTHGTHQSPHVASLVQTGITLLIVLGFFALQEPTEAAPDVAYFFLYGLMAILGTMAILIVQAITSVAVVVYFHVGKNHPETAHWWRTLLAPILGAVGMSYVVYLLASNLEFAAGAAAGSPIFKATPWIVVATLVIGVVYSLWLRSARPEIYAEVGRTTLTEAHER